MNPKMTVTEAAQFMGVTSQAIFKKIKAKKLQIQKVQNRVYLGYEAAKEIFNLKIKPTTYAVQIVKGGTGKSNITMNIAVRANLYGLKVLCIDLDQQANLTMLFGFDNVENTHVMYDILNSKNKIKLEKNLIEVNDGLHLFPSRLENAALDDIILLHGLGIDRVYKELIDPIKNFYDLILIDCPPALGRSVAAAAHASDKILAPVIPDKLCLSGLKMLDNMLADIENAKYGKRIPYEIIYNRFDSRTSLSRDILSYLLTHETYKSKLNANYIRQSQEFPNAAAYKVSIFDSPKITNAKEDIDLLTQSLLGIHPQEQLETRKEVSIVSVPTTKKRVIKSHKDMAFKQSNEKV